MTRFTLERVGTKRTRLTLDYYVDKDIASGLLFKLFRKSKLEKQYLKSLENLVPLVRDLRIPSAV